MQKDSNARPTSEVVGLDVLRILSVALIALCIAACSGERTAGNPRGLKPDAPRLYERAGIWAAGLPAAPRASAAATGANTAADRTLPGASIYRFDWGGFLSRGVWFRTGLHATFNPEDGSPAYAVYTFSLAGYDGEPYIELGWQSPLPAAADTWIGLSDWARGSWRWHAVDSAGIAVTAGLDPFIDEDGIMLVVVAYGGEEPCTLDWLRVGPADGPWHFETVAESADYPYYAPIVAGDGGADMYAAYLTTDTPEHYYLPMMAFAGREDGSWSGEEIVDLCRSTPALAVDSQGNLHVCYDGRGGAESGLMYYGFFDGDQWSDEELVGGNSSGMPLGMRLALDNEDRPHLVFGLDDNEIVYACRTDTGWELTTLIEGEGDWSGQISADIVVSPGGAAYVCYAFPGWPASLTVFTGEEWTSHYPLPYFIAMRSPIAIAVSQHDVTHVCLSQRIEGHSSRLRYCYLEGCSGGGVPDWHEEQVDGRQRLYDEVSITLDAAEEPHICYQTYRDDALSEPEVRYARRLDGKWVSERVTNLHLPDGGYPFVMDSAGRPHLAFATGWLTNWSNADEQGFGVVYAWRE